MAARAGLLHRDRPAHALAVDLAEEVHPARRGGPREGERAAGPAADVAAARPVLDRHRVGEAVVVLDRDRHGLAGAHRERPRRGGEVGDGHAPRGGGAPRGRRARPGGVGGERARLAMVTLNVAAPPPPPDGALVGEAAAGAGGEAPYLSSPPQESSRTLQLTRPSVTTRPQL